jgi:hypothetical protein
MELYTLDRNFHKKDIIDGFSSVIWTERYSGDNEVELVVPPGSDTSKKLPIGSFLGLEGSDEIMILETLIPEQSKLTGLSLLPWLNNRFVRTSAAHEDRYWYISGEPPGQVLWSIVFNMCCEGSPYLDGTINIGIADPQDLVIPGLGLIDYDTSGDNIAIGVPYGPLYNALKDIASTYQIGMQILLVEVTDTSYSLGFRSYKGLDRSSSQSVNPAIRFSPQMDSLANIKELQSIAALKTRVYAFAPGNPDGLATIPGVSSLSGPEYTGFDLRALMVFAEDITTDMVGGSTANLVNVLNSRAHDALTTNRYIATVDGEIVPENQFKYGVHYNLGDIIEVQGNSGVIQTARVTEYIRSQDSGGEKAYPSVTMIG